MNNEEKNLPTEEVKEENNEINTDSKKKLPMGALIGIIAGAVAVIAIVVVIILLSGNKCPGHVDADDDYLCDNCGEHYDDGDEDKPSENNDVEVTFTILLDNGQPLSGLKFTLTRGDKSYALTSGADGTAKVTIAPATYSLSYDYETMPEYCWIDIPGVKIEETTTNINITVIDNRPDGTMTKPFPVNAEEPEITLNAGEEFYYSCHAASLVYVSISSRDLEVVYNDVTYTYSEEDGAIIVPVVSGDVETPIIFLVRNKTKNSVSATMEIYAPPGSFDNPYELTGNTGTAEVAVEDTKYYVCTAEKDGILVVTSTTENAAILITRNIVKVVDGVEVIVNTITANNGYIYVTAGDEIKLGVSYVIPRDDNVEATEENNNQDTELHSVEFSLNLYSATDEDPAPIIDGQIEIRLDAGKSVVFSSEVGKTLTVKSSDDVTVTCNGSELAVGTEAILTDATFSVSNSTDKLVIFTVTIK